MAAQTLPPRALRSPKGRGLDGESGTCLGHAGPQGLWEGARGPGVPDFGQLALYLTNRLVPPLERQHHDIGHLALFTFLSASSIAWPNHRCFTVC